jgi:hypothetical protein
MSASWRSKTPSWLAGASVLAVLLAAVQPARAWEPVDWRHPKWKGDVYYFVRPASPRLTVARNWQAQIAEAGYAWRMDRCRHPMLAPVGLTDVRPDVSKHGADGISVIGWEESVWPYGKDTRAVTQARWGRDSVIVVPWPSCRPVRSSIAVPSLSSTRSARGLPVLRAQPVRKPTTSRPYLGQHARGQVERRVVHAPAAAARRPNSRLLPRAGRASSSGADSFNPGPRSCLHSHGGMESRRRERPPSFA